jgi:phosphate transport system permease protein
VSAVMNDPRLAMHRRRKRLNVVALTLSLAAMAFGVFWLIWILVETVRLGFGGLALAVFTEMTPPPLAETGGLANAIFGSLVMVSLATLLGTPIGVLAGIYLAEYGKKSWLGHTVAFINDILLSAPSIVIGLFIYAVVVAPLKGFSGIAGILALALIVIPVVIRQTENMLSLIPNALREAAYALGTPKWKVILSVTLKAGRGAHRRRDGAAAVHRAVQPVLDQRPARTDGQPAGHHLQVCDEPLRELAEAGLGRRLPDHAGCAAAQHPGARAVPRQALTPDED